MLPHHRPRRAPNNPLGLLRAFRIILMKGIRCIRELSRILDVDPRFRRLCLIEDGKRGYPTPSSAAPPGWSKPRGLGES